MTKEQEIAAYLKSSAATLEQRIRWFREARFGMFVTWGPYALVGRNEWVMDTECIPRAEYEEMVDRWRTRPGAPREWARLARKAGMKYMVLILKHLDGFCLWDSQTSDFNAARRGPKRDLVREFADACREFGLRVGFYFSVADWHFLNGTDVAIRDPEARRKWVDYVTGCVRELMTNYGRVDILWYDTGWPIPDGSWHSMKIAKMVRALQPQILINDRNMLREDFSTPEDRVGAAEPGRDWEACMTFNHASWGYMPSAARDAHGARKILRLLNNVCAGAGNLLQNIGPAPDGSVPPECVEPLTTVGRWLARNGEAVYGKLDRVPAISATSAAGYSRKGKTLYAWVHYWPGTEFPLGGITTRLKRASFLATGRPIRFEQKGLRIVLKGLPRACPDRLAGVAVLKLEFAAPPAAVPTSPWHLRIDRDGSAA